MIVAMPNADSESLALKMAGLQRWLDDCTRSSTTFVHYVDHAFAAVTVDPTSRSRAASFNKNAIRLCGGRGLSVSELNWMARLFSAADVERFFVWLSPGPGSDVIREWLVDNRAVQIPWTRYPTMVHTGRTGTHASTTLQVREVTRDDIEAAAVAPGHEAVMDGYLQSIGRPGFHHFAAFENSQLVATAALVQFEQLAYLTYACTAERFRRCGAQTALIAARIGAAQRLGCTLIVSETLTMLKDSFANLTRAEFQVAYEKEVYECVPPGVSRS